MGEAADSPSFDAAPAASCLFLPGHGGLSRTTRDEGAEVEVCPHCDEREAIYGYNPEEQILFSDWPVSVDRLLEEERVLIEWYRTATLLGNETRCP